MRKCLLIKYGEIALRKGNRKLYERALLDTLRARVRDMAHVRVWREQGRFVAEDARGDIDAAAVLSRLVRVFGVASFAVCLKTAERELAGLCEAALTFLRENCPPHAHTFKVETKRGDKSYPVPSQAVSAEIGGYILNRCPDMAVDVHRPDIVLWVEIRTCAYVYLQSAVPFDTAYGGRSAPPAIASPATVRGEGGLPYGSSGKGLLLLSGGIDSPVAGFLTARRGVELSAVYFHSPPYTSERACDKARDLCRVLAGYTGGMDLFIVPFTELQLFLYERVPPARLTLLIKRAMLRVASVLAAAEGALCLVTGDSVGQVSSQTVHALAAVSSAAELPVLRPLAAMDKQAIIDIAQRIGTLDISTRPFEDCCTLFVAEHPESKPRVSMIEHIEKRLGDELTERICRAAEGAERVRVEM